MGMFDSFRDSRNREWQTKAFSCDLDTYRHGDAMPDVDRDTYQVEVLGGGELGAPFIDSYATVRDGALAAVPDERDPSLPLLDYYGDWINAANGA